MIRVIALAVAAYLLGGLPASGFLAALIRRVVSGHERWLLEALELVAGIIAVSLVGQRADPLAQSLAATAAVAGRQWPLWTPHTPSSGLSVAAGALSVITPVAVPLWAMAWGLVYVTSGYTALGLVLATAVLPPLLGIFAGWGFGIGAIGPCLLLLDRQKDGLRRVLRGEAPRHYWRRGS